MLNTDFWLMNTALAKPTKDVLQAPPVSGLTSPMGKMYML